MLLSARNARKRRQADPVRRLCSKRPGSSVDKIYQIRHLRHLSTCDLLWSMLPGSELLIFRLDALAKAWSVIATATWLGGWVAGWLGVRHTPVLYQNGKTYRKTFSTI